jgi:L-iditol 2-dehydrogenase
MKALVLTAPSTLDYCDWPDPVPAPDEALLRIRACGICGSDVHGWDGSSGRRHPPLIMGHEAAGEIVALGANARRFRVGDRVTFDSTVYCGACAFCRRGEINLCEHRRVVGVAPPEYKQHGAFAELLALPERILHPLPAELTDERAAMVEPVAIALHAVARAPVGPTDTAVVIGTGTIGLLVVQALRVAGVGRIVAVDLDPAKLALAREFGAQVGLRPGQDDVAAELAALTDGRGADLSFEVVGHGRTLDLALSVLRRGGTAVLVGNLQSQVPFPLQAVVTREISVRGSCGSAGEYPSAIELIACGSIQVDPLLSHTAPLAEGASWFARLTRAENGLFKVILQP